MRWYAAFQCFGKAEKILQQISQQIRSSDLGTVVPRVCFERKPGRQFYLFMAIDSETPGETPHSIRTLLALPGLSRPIKHGPKFHPFKREDIKNMVASDIDVQDYARTLRWVALRQESDDPFACPPIEEALIVRDRSAEHRHFLLWLSAVGMGSYSVFQAGSKTLGLAADVTPAARILRRYRLLGHIECSPNGRHWSIAPPVLAELSTSQGQFRYILCGARDNALNQQLEQLAVVEEEPQPNGDGPPRLVVQFHSESEVSDAVASLKTAYELTADPAARKLAEVLPNRSDWLKELGTVEGVVPALFDLRRFKGSEFQQAVFDGTSGFYEFRHRSREGSINADFSLYFDSSTERWVRGDWYGLRFLALQNGRSVGEAKHDEENGKFAIRQAERWPELYERTLVLCSGLLPTRSQGWLIYENVPGDLALLLAQKLDVKIEGR